LYRTEPRIIFRYRRGDNGLNLLRTIPGFRVNYRANEDFRIYLDANIEFWNYSGEQAPENFRSTNFYIGYNYTF
ncbi:hypothetical protein, partial [Kaarinaea lacus]